MSDIMGGIEMMRERFALARQRIREIPGEISGEIAGGEAYPGVRAMGEYFTAQAEFLIIMGDTWDFVAEGRTRSASLEELKRHNHGLYRDILPENYEHSYANPAYAVKMLGEVFGGLCAFLAFEMRSLIAFAYEQRLEDVVIRMELFLEIYGVFAGAWLSGELPEYEEIRQIIYWFAFDYADVAAERRVAGLVGAEIPAEAGRTGEDGDAMDRMAGPGNLAAEILESGDFNDVRYLFRYGEYVSENELETAGFLAGLPQETIELMADTYTEGYRMGFVLGNKDLSKKKTVDVRYTLGYERMIQRAVDNFAAMGLKPAIYRSPVSILQDPALSKNGYTGANPNKQYDFDHKDDRALFLDKQYVNRRLEVMRTAYEKYKKEALYYAGPAVLETFGEQPFEPVNKPECIRMSGQQEELWVEYHSQGGAIQRQYILEEERSFTIIAFPVPEIGERFTEIFQEIIRINTLDYKLYQRLQQTIINALDRAEYCRVKGAGSNHTDLRISLCRLKDPARETKFENCVADVNIPVGEVFTSPVLKGTEGVLHVSRVYLSGLEYKDLSITFQDGMITDYTCGNFDNEEENKAFIKENILYHQKTLALGEFAIGTNTTAYVAARRFAIEDKLPILIAEKMGPHFAVGDTCYSHSEDIPVFNPDGKEIIARDNEVSILRKTKPQKAYYNCHTDITIPYDELGELSAVTPEGERIIIIENGRFVLEGCEALNEPLDES